MQLGLDGTEVPHPPRRPHALTERQRELLAYIRSHDAVRPLDIGVLMHVGRPDPCLSCALGADAHCEHASSDGVDALHRLARRGLVYRERRGRWLAVVAAEGWAP